LVEMVRVAGGSFQMGKDLGTAATGDVTPAHTVTLSDFSISKYLVTQEQYEAVMGSNPSYFTGDPAAGEVQGKRPVETVSWYDAVVFCNTLSIKEGLSPAYGILGKTDPLTWGTPPAADNDAAWDAARIVTGADGYRLPTEAQWEYAAKGGNQDAEDWTGFTYPGCDTIDDAAWYNGNSDSKTHEVGKKAANCLGLCDMGGNVWEWCWDWYDEYMDGTRTDPRGASSGVYRVERGGSWYGSAACARSVRRSSTFPGYALGFLGFRLARP
jgi:formylglycine-generating enzyme